MTGRPKLRFGIMCRDARHFPAWEAECIRRLIASGHAEPALLIRDVTPEPPREPQSVQMRARATLHRLWDERWVRPRLASLRPVDLSAELAGVESIDCAVTTRGAYSQHFTDADVATIRARELDFILRFGFNIIRGEILDAARFGVWSYHHDDERRYRGGPPGFWEIANGDSTTGAILQRLTDRLDGGVVLHRGVFGTCGGSWTHNIDRAFFGAADWCARVCAEIVTGQTQRLRGAPSTTTAAIRRAPTNAEVARCWARMGAHIARKLGELLFHVDVWNVGVTAGDHGVERILRDGALDARAITWCPPHARGRFIADPFAFTDGAGQARLLVEDYDHAGKGRICELRPPRRGDGARLELTAALETEHHLSYPCVFAHDDGAAAHSTACPSRTRRAARCCTGATTAAPGDSCAACSTGCRWSTRRCSGTTAATGCCSRCKTTAPTAISSSTAITPDRSTASGSRTRSTRSSATSPRRGRRARRSSPAASSIAPAWIAPRPTAPRW